jgi:hypothetical protein
MYIPEPAVVMRAGGKVEWVKQKGPEHVVFEYFIYCGLGLNAHSKYRELFERVQACSNELGSLAIVCRNYASKRDRVQHFHDKYLTGPASIPFEEWNANHLLLEEAVVDIQSFFWIASRLLNHIALTLSYFFRKVKLRVPSGQGVKSHSTLVESAIFDLLPSHLQDSARILKKSVSDFRNVDVEHDMKYWRSRKAKFAVTTPGDKAQVHITFPPTPNVRPETPLRELWIELHGYLTDIANFLGSQIK